MKKNKALTNYIYRRPLIGSKLVFLGALAMMIWSVWECIVRVDSFDRIFGVTVRFMKEQGLLKQYIQELLNDPGARMEILNPVILSGIALFALIVFFTSRYWKPAFLAIPLAALVMFFHTSENMIVRTFNLFETIKFASAGAIIGGEGLNVYSAIARRHQYNKQLAARKKARAIAARSKERTSGSISLQSTKKKAVILPPAKSVSQSKSSSKKNTQISTQSTPISSRKTSSRTKRVNSSSQSSSRSYGNRKQTKSLPAHGTRKTLIPERRNFELDM